MQKQNENLQSIVTQNQRDKIKYEHDDSPDKNTKLKRISPKNYLLVATKDSIHQDKYKSQNIKNKEQLSPQIQKGFEVWKEKDLNKSPPKHKLASIMENPIEIIKDMKKNKDKINDALSKSKSKRHSIWSEHNDSINSFDSNGWLKHQPNASFNFFTRNKLGILSSEHSFNSIALSNGHICSDKSNKNIFLTDQPVSLNVIQAQDPRLHKEIVFEQINSKNNKAKCESVEIVKTNLHEKSKSLSTKEPEVELTDRNKEGQSFAHEKSSNNERSLVDYLNERLEKEMGDYTKDRPKINKNFLSPEDKDNKDELKEQTKSPSSSFSPEIPKEIIEKDTSDLDKSENTRHISLKNFEPEPIHRSNAIDELNVQSKWLENYLKKESNKSDTNSHKSDKRNEDNVIIDRILYEEENPRNQTPEGIDDSSLAGQIIPSQSQNREENTTPREPKCDSDNNDDEIPVVTYSEDDKSSQDSYINKRLLKETKNSDESEEISDDNNDVQINFKSNAAEEISDLQRPVNLIYDEENKTSEQTINPNKDIEMPNTFNQPMSDRITNDLFYEILADIITDPFPRRDLSIFSMQPQMNRRIIIDSDRRKCFELLAIEKYLEEVIEAIMENESGFIDNLLEPVRRNPIDMLQLLQNSDLGSYEHFENIALKQPVLNLDLYLDIERNKEEKRLTEQANKQIIKHLEIKEENDTQTAEDDDEQQIEFEQIHRKMIFDCINEGINRYRPYGENGVPMPWSSSTRRLCSNDILNFEKVFNGIKDNLFKWGTTQAGTMPSFEYIINQLFDEELFAEVREKRLAALLSNEVHETENKWLVYDFEEAQVKNCYNCYDTDN